MSVNRRWIVILTLGLVFACVAANATNPPEKRKYSLLADDQTDASGGHGKHEEYPRRLASGDPQADLDHYRNLTRRLGVDLGLFIPFGDFANVAEMTPMLGLHFVWEAIAPFSFTVSYRRASATNKTTPATGKLSVNQINLGTQASFPVNRFIPFIKVEGGFLFVDYRNNADLITGGDDALLTTVGFSAGIGFDFVVGREVSLGVDAMYHYPVKKTVSTSGTFNLGSPFATIGFRLNF